MRDFWPLVLASVGLAGLLRPVPVARAPQVLRWFGRRVGVAFTFDERGRLAAGVEAERLVIAMIWRVARANSVFVAGLGIGYLLLLHGPPLSRSTVESVAVASAICASIIGPYLLVRPFFGGFGARETGASRTAGLEDYLGPVRRVLGWLAALSALVIPLSAAALAEGAVYDGSKIFWEGLVGIPLTAAGVLVALEVQLRRVRDSTVDGASLYLWDGLRARSVRLVTAVATTGIGIAWQMAYGGLNGVALERSSRHVWVGGASTIAWTLSLVFMITGIVLLLTPPLRFRRGLWPSLGSEDLVRWGAPPA